jgi:hypothetical protein
MADALRFAIENGPFAVMLFAMCGYHFWWTKAYRKERDEVRTDHKDERKEWRESHDILHKETSSVVRDNNNAMRELTKAISSTNKKRRKNK